MAEGGKTHVKILSDSQQYALKRYLKLEAILPSLKERKVISKKWGKRLEENYDVDLFLALLKNKDVEAFTKFFEVLEETFEENKDHKTLVGGMSKRLLQISDADPEQRERIRRVVVSATGEKSLGTRVGSEEGQTDISSVTQKDVLVDRGPFEVEGTYVTAPPLEPSVSQQKPEPLQIPITGGKSELPHGEEKEEGEDESSTVHTAGESNQLSPNQAQSQTLEPHILNPEPDPGTELRLPLHSSFQTTPSFPLSNQLPCGFVAPPIFEYFPRSKLINSEWCFHNAAHGISIHISEDAVPPEIDCFALQIHAYLQGPFQFHEEYELCTAIFHLRVHSKPPFQFLKPVTLRIPHSALFEEDDEPDDFVILQAPDPDDAIPPDGHTAIHPVYEFTNIIREADFSSGYHVEVKLQHFSSVAGGKKKHKYRHPRSSSLHRQGSQVTQRKGRKKRRLRKIVRQGSSIGSSRQSSYEGSFEEAHSKLKHQQSPLVKQCSSVESDAPLPPRLTRQVAMDNDHKGHSTPSPCLSSSLDDANDSCNELCISCCSPVSRTCHWKTSFMAACHHPTGMMALRSAINNTNMNMDWEEKCVIPDENYISFSPMEHEEGNWRVCAETTPKINLDQVTSLCRVESGGQTHMYPPCITYSVQRLYSALNRPLSLEIHVIGAAGDTNFTISSTVEPTPTGRMLHSPSWLYPEGSKIQQSLQSETDITLSPFEIDHCKLIADISFQLTHEEYLALVRKINISQAKLDHLEMGETDNLPECIYKVLTTWLGAETVTLHTLKSVLGISKIETNVPPPLLNPDLDGIPCDKNSMLELRTSISKQWRFFGRYLGVPCQKLDELLQHYHAHDPLDEIVYSMFRTWHCQYEDASIGALLKVIYRVWKLSPNDGAHAWFVARKMASENTYTS